MRRFTKLGLLELLTRHYFSTLEKVRKYSTFKKLITTVAIDKHRTPWDDHCPYTYHSLIKTTAAFVDSECGTLLVGVL
jgi:hypothetical protein